MKDFGLWTSFELEKKLSKRFDLEMEAGNRLKDNLNQRDETFIGLGLSWSKRDISLSSSYRFTNEKAENRYELAHRFYIQGQYEYEINRFTLEYRARGQVQYKSINSSQNGHLPESFLRNRIKLDYNIKGIPLKPKFSYESFLRINRYVEKQIEKRRFILGLGYKMNKDNQIGVSYMLQETTNKVNPLKRYILGIDYKLEI